MSSFQELIQSDKPVLVDFFAEWCAPCKMMAPELKTLVNNIGDKAKVVKIDIDKNEQASRVFKIKSVPTLMIFQKGELKWRQSGYLNATQLENALKPFMS
ncbi:MAG: thioredoxin [Flammeovirgaceae bacterium]